MIRLRRKKSEATLPQHFPLKLSDVIVLVYDVTGRIFRHGFYAVVYDPLGQETIKFEVRASVKNLALIIPGEYLRITASRENRETNFFMLEKCTVVNATRAGRVLVVHDEAGEGFTFVPIFEPLNEHARQKPEFTPRQPPRLVK